MPYRPVTREGITLLCFPPYDEVLARLTAERLEMLAGPDPEALQASLRTVYPDATVRPRESIASLGDGVAWYVYRDGRYSPYADDEPWWEAEDVARLEIDADGRYVGATQAALDLIGIDLETLRSMRSGELTLESTRPTVAWIWQLLEDVGELHSTSVLRTPDGRHIPIEYRLIRGASDDAISYSFVREIPPEAAEPSGIEPDDRS